MNPEYYPPKKICSGPCDRRNYGGITMRLRRLELVVIGVTLAFACFIGGFFTGRSWSAVNIVPASLQSDESNRTDRVLTPTGSPEPSEQGGQTGTSPEVSDPQLPSDNSPPAQDTVHSETAQESAGAPRTGDGRININLASQSELTDLPGIGSVLASRIVDYRRQHGDFNTIEDIRNVSGIGEKRYEAIQDKITVG